MVEWGGGGAPGGSEAFALSSYIVKKALFAMKYNET
jgi:hypothetical protein